MFYSYPAMEVNPPLRGNHSPVISPEHVTAAAMRRGVPAEVRGPVGQAAGRTDHDLIGPQRAT
jgi:hypothetical protein